MRRAVPATVLLLAAVGACGSGSSSAGSDGTSNRGEPGGSHSASLDCDLPPTGTHEIDLSGTRRSYDVYAPDSVASPPPLLMLFHGFTSTSGEIARVSDLAELAPRRGVVLVAPQGAGEPSDWNVIAGFDQDAAFIDTLIDHLRGFSCLSDSDLWLAGFSAGAAFSGVYGCARAATVTGLAMLSGLPPPVCPEDDTPRVVITHGTNDPLVPFAGGPQPVGDTIVHLAPVPESAAAWAERAGCEREPTERQVADDVTVTTWAECARPDTVVSLQVVQGGGHTWPTGSFRASCRLLHAVTRTDGGGALRCQRKGSR